jgi:hypothetical protein
MGRIETKALLFASLLVASLIFCNAQAEPGQEIAPNY